MGLEERTKTPKLKTPCWSQKSRSQFPKKSNFLTSFLSFDVSQSLHRNTSKVVDFQIITSNLFPKGCLPQRHLPISHFVFNDNNQTRSVLWSRRIPKLPVPNNNRLSLFFLRSMENTFLRCRRQISLSHHWVRRKSFLFYFWKWDKTVKHTDSQSTKTFAMLRLIKCNSASFGE